MTSAAVAASPTHGFAPPLVERVGTRDLRRLAVEPNARDVAALKAFPPWCYVVLNDKPSRYVALNDNFDGLAAVMYPLAPFAGCRPAPAGADRAGRRVFVAGTPGAPPVAAAHEHVSPAFPHACRYPPVDGGDA